MATPTRAIKNLGSLIFGAVLLLIGLVASFYNSGEGIYGGKGYSNFYPYQTIGIILILIGIVFVGLGLFYSPRKINDLPPPPKNP
jgi:vacuolar-type H+-ATPase subunit I/STV1